MKKARFIREIEELLRGVNDRYSYEEVLVPTIAPVTVYEKGVASESMIKFFHGSELLALRPDFTTGVVHALSANMPVPKSHRVSYFGTVFKQDGKIHENHQAGIECFLSSSLEADREVLTMVHLYLQQLGLQNYVVSVGLVPVINALCRVFDLETEKGQQLKTFLQRRDYVSLNSLCKSELNTKQYQQLWTVFTSRNSTEVMSILQELIPEVCEKSSLGNILASLPEGFVTDFSLIKSLDYYTGLIFDAYIPQSPYPILSGGRYDRLPKKYGLELPAVGFAVNMDYLWEALANA